MSTITTRAGKGSPLTNAEVDANFTNLNSDKYESGDAPVFASVQLSGGTGTQGTLTWDTDEDTLHLSVDGISAHLAQDVFYHVRNNSGAQIDAGTVVYATGTIGASGRITVGKFIANGTIGAKYMLGVTAEDIANDADGKVSHFGKIRQIDLSGFSAGSILYASSTTAGALTATEPTGTDLSLPIAFVVNNASNGTLFVRSTNLDANAFATATQGDKADTAQSKNTLTASSTATTTLDFNEQNFIITLVGNTTLSLSNVATNVGMTGTIVFKQNATGGHSITFPSEFKTPRAEAIVQETAANTISAVNYFVVDANTILINYIGDFG
jgi:hypothetical protein